MIQDCQIKARSLLFLFYYKQHNYPVASTIYSKSLQKLCHFKQSNFNVVDVAVFRGSKVPRPEMVKLPLSTTTCGSSRHMVSMSMMRRRRRSLMIVTMILMKLTIVTPNLVANTTHH